MCIGMFSSKEKKSSLSKECIQTSVVWLVKQDHNTHPHKLTEGSNSSNKNGNQKCTSTIPKGVDLQTKKT